MSFPTELFGTWTYDKNEKLDEFLESQGVPWLIRKAAILAGETISFADLGDGKYSAEHSMFGRSNKYSFRIGDTIRNTGLEGVERKITFSVEGSAFVESHNFEFKDKPNEPSKQLYHVENGRMVQSLSNKEVACRIYFKRKN